MKVAIRWLYRNKEKGKDILYFNEAEDIRNVDIPHDKATQNLYTDIMYFISVLLYFLLTSLQTSTYSTQEKVTN